MTKKEDWLLLQSGPGDPAFNMAVDEACSNRCEVGKTSAPFYSWTEAGCVVRCFQKYVESTTRHPVTSVVRTANGWRRRAARRRLDLQFGFPVGTNGTGSLQSKAIGAFNMAFKRFCSVSLTTELAPCAVRR